MSRKNVDHTREDIERLAGDLEDYANQLRALAKRFETDDLEEPVSLSHRYGIDDGLIALSRFTAELDQKQRTQIVERARRTSRGPFSPRLEQPAMKKRK